MSQPIELSNSDLPALRDKMFAAAVRAESPNSSFADSSETSILPDAVTEIRMARRFFEHEVHNRLWSVDAESELNTLLSEFTEQAAIKQRLALAEGGLLSKNLQRFLEVEV